MSSSGSKPQEETVPTVEIEVECADVDEPGDVAVEILPEVDGKVNTFSETNKTLI